MGFLAAAIPIATSILGAMSKEDPQQQQQQAPAKPGLGEIFAANDRNFSQGSQINPFNQPMGLNPVGGKGPNG